MKVLLIEDQHLLSCALSDVLHSTEDVEIVGFSDKASESIDLCQTLSPDLVIMDVYTNDGNGIEYTAIIKKLFPNIKVMVITGYEDVSLVQAAEAAGADIFTRKNISLEEFREFIHYARRPYRLFPNTFQNNAQDHENLTPLDLQIISLLAKGQSSREIADELFISYGTVRVYISRMYAATGSRSRAQLVAYALNKGLIDQA